jgi:hypothetical protein
VLNKIDVLRPADKETYLADAREKLGAPAEDFVPAAFDPLPQLAAAPLHVDAVKGWIARRLAENGKPIDILPALRP